MPYEPSELLKRQIAYVRGEGPKPDGAGQVYLGDGKVIFGSFGCNFVDKAKGLDVSIDVVMDGPTAVCVGLKLRRTDRWPLTRDDLKSLPLTSWLDRAVEAVATPLLPGQAVSGPPLPTRRRSVTDEDLREVAKVYSAASHAPTRAVEAAFPGMSWRTAARRVQQARKRGFLPPSDRREPRKEDP